MYSAPFFPQQPYPKCCGCMPLRFGSGLICFIWAAFSMYLAVLSFQNSSLFYSYLPQPAITICGVVNLILSLVSVGGLVILIVNAFRYVRTLSHAIFVCVFLVLVDGFINIVLFITNQNNFYTWCVDNSSFSIEQTINATAAAFNTTAPYINFAAGDYYNCHNLWQGELKFSIIFFILMFAFYVYWSLCVYSFSIITREYFPEATGTGPPMMRTAEGLAVPPPAMINQGARGHFTDEQSVIVLRNQKPKRSSKKSKRIESFSFRNLKQSIAPASVAPQDQLYVPYGASSRRDSQFTIGFRLGPDGNIIDIENAPSPTPTCTSNELVFFDSQQEQLKQKPLSKN